MVIACDIRKHCAGAVGRVFFIVILILICVDRGGSVLNSSVSGVDPGVWES